MLIYKHYALIYQVRWLNKTFCSHVRKYSAGDVLFSGRGKRIVPGAPISEDGEGSVFAVHLPSETPLVATL